MSCEMDFLFLICLNSGASAPPATPPLTPQPLNFLDSADLACPSETAVVLRVALFVALRSAGTFRGASAGQESWLEVVFVSLAISSQCLAEGRLTGDELG